MGRRNLILYLLLNVFISACVAGAILFWYDQNYRSAALSPLQPPARLVESSETVSQPTTALADDVSVKIVSVVGAGFLDAESVTIRNEGEASLNLSGWQLKDSDKNIFTFPNLTLNPGGAVRIHTGPGTANVIDLYWNAAASVWESGEEAQLFDPMGTNMQSMRFRKGPLTAESCEPTPAMSQALYRKYRPKEWDEVMGQDHIVTTLKNAITADRVAHAYLFAGSRGTGKTTLARLLAKAVNCLHPDPAKRPDNECENCRAVNDNRFLDLIEIDAASNNGVDDVRDLRDKINFSPSQGKYKIYIMDEVHMLSTPAFNALLKTLEEPPPHAIFVLATTEIHKIPATVLSRCQRHEFRRVPVDEIVANLKKIIKAEKIQADDDALIQIARQSAGGMRDAISLLDQLSSTGDRITLALAQTVLGTATSQTVLDVISSINDHDPAHGLETIHKALDAGADPRSLARQIVEYLRGTDAHTNGQHKPGRSHRGCQKADAIACEIVHHERCPAHDESLQQRRHGSARRLAALPESGTRPGRNPGRSRMRRLPSPRSRSGQASACSVSQTES
jgi:DNA polymerase III subunit gamma/tau